ncbi:MAG: 23S rRNA (pseudouridine(1915)-N(3))-methyltransferase RlmH [bacterium]|nr:23S rRNA (pseudouridine(1915)-N(3))-methyltransferase RlmH [bacterium]
MAITLLIVGKKRSDELSRLCDDYISRIKQFDEIEVKYVKDAGELKDDADEVIKKESERILKEMKNFDKIFLLDRTGEELDSHRFSQLLGKGSSCFIVGGSHGVNQKVKDSSSRVISFSKMTFPHRLFRVMLLEQIYRGFTITKKMRYHK